MNDIVVKDMLGVCVCEGDHIIYGCSNITTPIKMGVVESMKRVKGEVHIRVMANGGQQAGTLTYYPHMGSKSSRIIKIPDNYQPYIDSLNN